MVFQIKNAIAQCNILMLHCFYEVVLIWIPSHSGIAGNEKVDEIAKEAVVCGDKYCFKNYCHDLLSLPKTYLRKTWNSRWQSSSKTKGYKFAIIQPDIPRKTWFSKIGLSKMATSSIIRMRLGHCSSPVHLAKLRIRDSSICECGLEEGDLNHIFLSCPLYNHSHLYRGLISRKNPLPTQMSTLLSSLDAAVYRFLAIFLIVNKIKI
jgi:hypothetical protein